MNMNIKISALLATASLVLAGCGNGADQPAPAADSATTGKPAPATSETGAASPGKPTAPIDLKYEIVGNPIVGNPVLINIEVRSLAGPVRLAYSITDTSALVFQPGQVERLEIADPSGGSQQLSVVPQREGRLYVNVSAEVDAPGGSMIRSMAIPIRVGAAPDQPATNGEFTEAPGGESVISLPAREDTEPPE